MKRTIGVAALVLVLLSRASVFAAAPTSNTLTGLDIIELEISKIVH